MKPYPPITDYMATKLVTFHPDMDIREAIDILLKKKISGAPVLDANGQLIGMLSEADCLRILIEGPYNHEPSSAKIKVGDYMSGRVKHIPDSWRGREPAMPTYKQTFYGKNS